MWSIVNRESSLREETKAIYLALDKGFVIRVTNIVRLVIEYHTITFAQVGTQALAWIEERKVVRNEAHFALLYEEYFNLLYKFAHPYGGSLSSLAQSFETAQTEECLVIINKMDMQWRTPQLTGIRDIAFHILEYFERIAPNKIIDELRRILVGLGYNKAMIVIQHALGLSRLRALEIKQKFPNEIMTIDWDVMHFKDLGSPEMVVWVMRYVELRSRLKKIKTLEDCRYLERKMLEQRELVSEICKHLSPNKRNNQEKNLKAILNKCHIQLFYQAVNLDLEQTLHLWKKWDLAQPKGDLKFISHLCPEIISLTTILSRRQNATTATYYSSLIVVFRTFCKNAVARQFTYSFIYTLLQRQNERVDPLLKVLTPEQFSSLDCDAELGFAAGMSLEAIRSLYQVDVEERPVAPASSTSSTAHASFAAEPHHARAVVKKKKEKTDPLAYLSRSSSSKENLLPHHAAAPIAPAAPPNKTTPFPKLKPKPLRYAQRVQERLKASRPLEADEREDAWAHGFTRQLDTLIGSSYCSTVKKPHTQTGRMETHHSFIVIIENDEDAEETAMIYIATYTIDDQDVCYHRCLQKKSRDALFDALAQNQVDRLVDYPSLAMSHAALKAGKPLIEEVDQEPMQLDNVFRFLIIKDKKHKITLKVLPRIF